MSSKNIKQLVTAAVLLALTLVFQNIRLLVGDNPVSTYLIGTLVNICLILAACLVNTWGGLLIAVAAPLVAFLQGYVKNPLLLPFLMAGNAVLVLLVGIVGQKFRKTGDVQLVPWTVTGVLAALLKFALIASGNALALSAKQGTVFFTMLGAGAGMQVQQIVTAIIALAVCYVILPRLKKAAG